MIKQEKMKKIQSKLPTLKLTIQSINDIITNSSSEVVIKYDKGGVDKIKDLVNNLLEPFTELKFDDLFTVVFLYNDENGDECELDENDPKVEEILEESWKQTWDGGYPNVYGIEISIKKGKEALEGAANILSQIAYIFETEVIYG